jgi:competence protein ComEA
MFKISDFRSSRRRLEVRRLAALVLGALLTCSLVVPASAVTEPARSAKPAVTLINLNTADVATLAREMEGIGEAKARAIVEHRQRNGAFKSVDELALVKGIGAKTLAVNRPRLTVGTAAAAKTSPRTPGPAAAR